MSDNYYKDLEEIERRVQKLKDHVAIIQNGERVDLEDSDLPDLAALDEIEKFLKETKTDDPPSWQQWIKKGKDWCLTISAYLGLIHLIYQTILLLQNFYLWLTNLVK